MTSESASPAAADAAPPVRLNFTLLVLHGLAAGWQLFVLPLVLLPLDARWGLTLVPLIALNNPLWALIHEAIHGLFHPDGRVNRLAGRWLAICHGAPFAVLRTGHLLHHRFNRSAVERQEMYDAEITGRAGAMLSYYFQLVAGMYLTQVASMLAFFLPQPLMTRLAERLPADGFNARAAAALLRPDVVGEIRRDSLVVIGLYGAGAWAYGADAWILLAALAARGLCISFLDYVYHYASPLDDRLHAYNLRLPTAVQAALLNFNLHGVHHRHPGLPWRALPAAFARDGARFDGGYGAFALRQLRGPLPLPFPRPSSTGQGNDPGL